MGCIVLHFLDFLDVLDILDFCWIFWIFFGLFGFFVFFFVFYFLFFGFFAFFGFFWMFLIFCIFWIFWILEPSLKSRSILIVIYCFFVLSMCVFLVLYQFTVLHVEKHAFYLDSEPMWCKIYCKLQCFLGFLVAK